MLPSLISVSLPDMPHAIAGKPIVPAVELLNFLAQAVDRRGISLGTPLTMRDVTFPRFLPANDIPRCTFEVALEEPSQPGGGIRARLSSRIELPGGIQRHRTHVAVTFGGQVPPAAQALPEADVEYEIAAERVYRELIRFGPHFCNLQGPVRLARAAAWATVASPTPPHPNPSKAGCPYLLDSAMHLACVWGQRYAGIVAYPTGFSARKVPSPIAHGQRRCVVMARGKGPRHLQFDLWLIDEEHRVCDAVDGLVMAPLAMGSPPPDWIALPQGTEVNA
jgi:hypothetical protein